MLRVQSSEAKMGGVCSGRLILKNEKPGTKIAVISAKVNSVDGFTKQGGSSPNDNGNQIAREKCDSDELELKQPTLLTPKKAGNKVHFSCFLFSYFVRSDDASCCS